MCVYIYIYTQERKKKEKGNNSPEETPGLKFTKDRISIYISSWLIVVAKEDRGRVPCNFVFRYDRISRERVSLTSVGSSIRRYKETKAKNRIEE